MQDWMNPESRWDKGAHRHEVHTIRRVFHLHYGINVVVHTLAAAVMVAVGHGVVVVGAVNEESTMGTLTLCKAWSAINELGASPCSHATNGMTAAVAVAVAA